MADRLEQIRRIKQGIGCAKDHVDKSDWHAAVMVQGALIEQLLAVVEGEDLNSQSDPDRTITFAESASACDVPATWYRDCEDWRIAYEKGENNE